MRRQGNLLEQIAEPDILRLAFCKAARGKRNRAEVRLFQAQLHEELELLRRQLLTGEVAVGSYRFFTVFEPKKREICAAVFRERVLHHALMHVIEPIFERYAIDDSYACRKNKGLHAAVGRAKELSRRFPCCLKLDIAKYFDSIDHEMVMEMIARLIKDKKVLRIFNLIIDSYHTKPGKGMPIGNLISQHVANLYLGSFDHWVKEHLGVRGYVRYMDDFLLFGQDRERLRTLLGQVEEYLMAKLKLTLHHDRQLHRTTTGIAYLGYRIFPDGIKLSAKSRNRFARKFRRYEDRYLRGEWDMETLNRHMTALIGFTAGADSTGFRRKVVRTGRVPAEGTMASTA